MIPNINALDNLQDINMGNDNYKMLSNGIQIIGVAKELESMKQVVYKILNTHRYNYVIYSWNYGIEINDLYGESLEYCKVELERRITEALIQDDRIESVSNFEFENGNKKNELTVKFTVNTIFGEFDERKVVNY